MSRLNKNIILFFGETPYKQNCTIPLCELIEDVAIYTHMLFVIIITNYKLYNGRDREKENVRMMVPLITVSRRDTGFKLVTDRRDGGNLQWIIEKEDEHPHMMDPQDRYYYISRMKYYKKNRKKRCSDKRYF